MSKWYKASEIERLKNLTPRDGVTGLPDNHVITVSERVISVDNTELVQNNIATDTFTLVLDAEWDGITPVVIFTNNLGNYQVAYENAPTKIPAAAMAGIGAVEVSVFGLDSTGAVRVVTKAAPNTMNVVKSGKFVGEVSSDDASLLGQILAAAEAANEAAANANASVIKSAIATTLNPGEQATANLADHVLTIGVPKGEKGEKGEKGDTGDPGHSPQRGVDYWTTEDVKAVVEDAKAQAVAELAEVGNVPKRTVTDLVAHGEDAYAQKPIEVRIKGRTVKNLWPVINKSVSSVTVSTDSNGLITVTGTSAGGSVYLSERITGVVPGDTVTLLINNEMGWNTGLTQAYLRFDDSSGTLIPEHGWVGIAATTTIPEGAASVSCGFETVKNGDVNWTGRVMLVEGSEVPDCFTPPASITSVRARNLVTTGENLVEKIVYGYPNGGWPRKFIMDGNSVTVIFSAVAGTEYIFSASQAPDRNVYGYLDTANVVDGTKYRGRNIAVFSDGKMRLTPNESGIVYFYVSATKNDAIASTAQLELGSTATAYKPPNITRTPLPEVELRSLPNGTCDELVINADGTCEVERRTQLVDGEVVAIGTPTTEPQSPVTLPVLPAPTFNQYHDNDVPSDTSTTYTRDINIVIDNLAKQINTTQATISVDKASTIE